MRKQVLISNDPKNYIFDYNPLIKEIDRLAGLCGYETQEILTTYIASACATFTEIKAIEISPRKVTVLNSNGLLGVRLILYEAATNELRSYKKSD